jgi:hypothetical protein
MLRNCMTRSASWGIAMPRSALLQLELDLADGGGG